MRIVRHGLLLLLPMIGCAASQSANDKESGELANPDAPCDASAETCDGVDNDCNGLVDDQASDAGTWYLDADADGHGDGASPIVACAVPDGAASLDDDCDDQDAAVHPAAGEVCNELDDDCDGAVDTADSDLTEACETDTGGDTGEEPGTAAYPGDLLDLTNWKLTLPTGEAETPEEISQPELATFVSDPYFTLNAGRSGVLFNAPAGGVTTSNSGYPRSELREMTDGGATRADWSTTSGVHTMTITEAITHLPEVKPHVVAGQIHDAEDDVVMIRLEGSTLFVEGGGENLGVLDADYVLGTEFTVRFVAADGMIEVYHDDMTAPAVSVARDTTGCYFKAGAYTQSNPERGEAPDAYGEVEIRDLVVTHE
ncbi:MAG: polysaccharide lyase family 7 protein [Pseudomonadota bacterium]|nr:polysaccharide lyase family 7 protein [Pseudomonadota bacterium]